MSRCLYDIRFLALSTRRWDKSETLQGIIFRQCLGLPIYSENISTLVGAQLSPRRVQDKAKVFRHPESRAALLTLKRWLPDSLLAPSPNFPG